MSFRYEIRLSGSGGQGLILAGQVLAEAAAIYDDNNATQSQSYGPEARGGASRSDVIIADEEIDYPKATHIDLLLAFTQEACDKYISDLKTEGILLIDSTGVTKIPEGGFEVHAFPMTDIATQEMGRAVVANILALGLIAGLSKVVSPAAMEQAIRARVPKGSEELNLKAFRKGLEMTEKINTQTGG